MYVSPSKKRSRMASDGGSRLHGSQKETEEIRRGPQSTDGKITVVLEPFEGNPLLEAARPREFRTLPILCPGS